MFFQRWVKQKLLSCRMASQLPYKLVLKPSFDNIIIGIDYLVMECLQLFVVLFDRIRYRNHGDRGGMR
ncbi:hypothetical protein I7I53_06352 [Histoplasma capsulatum var. duboisii H88]|uniref:Uncharacterized protein n=1 Tax=Ajellomyces capsulatus (strain H88) TaxID=544711 RepID=A0A8A1LEN0_AJEC8|nr:hypothetical protein I7I53_06352 [Histoplasma capsulatum var. duboisii H88]